MRQFAALLEAESRLMPPPEPKPFDYEADRERRMAAREPFIADEYDALPTKSKFIIALEDVCQPCL
jgi:hypothetical protein